jgi:hypothetical protein
MSEKGDPHNACYEWIEERATAERNVNELILHFTDNHSNGSHFEKSYPLVNVA